MGQFRIRVEREIRRKSSTELTYPFSSDFYRFCVPWKKSNDNIGSLFYGIPWKEMLPPPTVRARQMVKSLKSQRKLSDTLIHSFFLETIFCNYLKLICWQFSFQSNFTWRNSNEIIFQESSSISLLLLQTECSKKIIQIIYFTHLTNNKMKVTVVKSRTPSRINSNN